MVFTVLPVLFALFQWLLPQPSESQDRLTSNVHVQELHTSSSLHSSRTRRSREQPQPKEPIAWYEWVQVGINTFFDIFNSIEALLIYPMIGLVPAFMLYFILLIMRLNNTPLATVLFLGVFFSVAGMSFLADYVSTMKRTVARLREEKRQERPEQHFS